MPLIEDVPRYVVMIGVPQQGETVHHTDTKAKLDSEWMPRFNQALKEHGLVGHVVVYQPSSGRLASAEARGKSSPAPRDSWCTRRTTRSQPSRLRTTKA